MAQRFSGGSQILDDLKAKAESYKGLIMAAFDKGKKSEGQSQDRGQLTPEL